MNDISLDAVDAVIQETRIIPEELLRFYRDLPGRSPSEHSKNVSRILSSLSDEEAIILIRDVVDSTVFSMLHLLDLSFKDRHIQVTFTRQQDPEAVSFGSLLDTYRERVDPGGKVVD